MGILHLCFIFQPSASSHSAPYSSRWQAHRSANSISSFWICSPDVPWRKYYGPPQIPCLDLKVQLVGMLCAAFVPFSQSVRCKILFRLNGETTHASTPQCVNGAKMSADNQIIFCFPVLGFEAEIMVTSSFSFLGTHSFSFLWTPRKSFSTD